MSTSNHTSDKPGFKSPDEITPEDIERFWDKVDRRSADECWEWQAATNGKGYGVIKIGCKIYYAHRLSYRIHNEPCPHRVICHSCDNPRCVNPSHLWAGTQGDNLRDAIRKGRKVSSPNPYWLRHQGEAHHNSKLTDADIVEIRRLLAEGELLQREIGERFGITQQAVSRIKNGIGWTHVNELDPPPGGEE